MRNLQGKARSKDKPLRLVQRQVCHHNLCRQRGAAQCAATIVRCSRCAFVCLLFVPARRANLENAFRMFIRACASRCPSCVASNSFVTLFGQSPSVATSHVLQRVACIYLLRVGGCRRPSGECDCGKPEGISKCRQPRFARCSSESQKFRSKCAGRDSPHVFRSAASSRCAVCSVFVVECRFRCASRWFFCLLAMRIPIRTSCCR